MRRSMLILAALLAAATAAASEAPRGVSDPRAFVARTYADYAQGSNAAIPAPVRAYSPRLAALFEAYERDLGGGDLVGSLDFDWWVNAQDWRLADIAVTEAADGSDRRIVTARWRNYDRADSSRFLFVRENDRWLLDDVVNGSGGGGDGWTLSALLRERPE